METSISLCGWWRFIFLILSKVFSWEEFMKIFKKFFIPSFLLAALVLISSASAFADDTDWTVMNSNTTAWFYDVWGSSASNVFAVGGSAAFSATTAVRGD